MISEKRIGELCIAASTLLSSVFPALAVLMLSTLSPMYAVAITTGLSTFFFAAVLTLRRRWTFPTSLVTWRNILLATLLNGIIFHALIFIGYQFTSAGNGAVIQLMEVCFTFLIVNMLVRHERLVMMHAAGAVLMVIGAAFILLPQWNGTLQIGDLLILAATIVTPIGNMFAQKARSGTSAEMMMFVRSLIAAPFFLMLATVMEVSPQPSTIFSSLVSLMLIGFLVMGLSKIFWLEAMHRVSIAKSISLSSLSVPLALFFAWVILGQSPTLPQLLATLPMIGGMVLLLRK